MELERVDTRRAYQLIREKIVTLELAPGAAINEQTLAQDLGMGLIPVREALKLLEHDELVVIPPRHGPYVTEVSIPDLEQISEMRLALESLAARLAAQRIAPDDLVVLDVLCYELASITPTDLERLFDLDHKFHQAIARAARNKYLTATLERHFGLSQRLWYLVLPHLAFLPSAVEEHLDLVEAFRTGDADRAEGIMHEHVEGFYNRVKTVLLEKGDSD
jgi:DNA-binding GntR family transcriptional regulator